LDEGVPGKENPMRRISLTCCILILLTSACLEEEEKTEWSHLVDPMTGEVEKRPGQWTQSWIVRLQNQTRFEVHLQFEHRGATAPPGEYADTYVEEGSRRWTITILCGKRWIDDRFPKNQYKRGEELYLSRTSVYPYTIQESYVMLTGLRGIYSNINCRVWYDTQEALHKATWYGTYGKGVAGEPE